MDAAQPKGGGLSVFSMIKMASTGMTSGVRKLVSKKKRRFVEDGFDLDLSYITEQLIAMGYPCTGAETVYRNPASKVAAFMAAYHRDTCKVFNLCIERSYPASHIRLPDDLVETYGTRDHNAMPLFSLLALLRSMALWLDRSPAHVAAVHCKAGKGRTGMVICAYLVWSGKCSDAASALRLFGERRTTDGEGVTIPSQRRYVEYALKLRALTGGAAAELPMLREAERRIASDRSFAVAIDVSSSTATPATGRASLYQELGSPQQLFMPPLLRILRIELRDAPEFVAQQSTYFTVELVHRQDDVCSVAAGHPHSVSPRWRAWRVYDHRELLHAQEAQHEQPPGKYEGMVCDPKFGLPLIAGDVKVGINLGSGKSLAHFWFHTAFITLKEGDKCLELPKSELDRARRNKSLPNTFAVRVLFEQPLSAEDQVSEREKLANSAQMSLIARAGGASTLPSHDHDEVEDEDDEDTVTEDEGDEVETVED